MGFGAIFHGRGLVRLLTAVTVVYVLIIAGIFLFFISSFGPKIDDVLLGEAVFASPVIIAYGLAMWFNSVPARRTLLGFDVAFALFSWLIFHQTFSNDEEAQYQLLLLKIPMIGFPCLLMAGALAALYGRAKS
jgi:CHASE2 domain-containing sensor protein